MWPVEFKRESWLTCKVPVIIIVVQVHMILPKATRKTSRQMDIFPLSTMFALLCLLCKFVGVGILKASANASRSVFTGSKKENIKFIHLCAFCFFCVNTKLAFSLQKRLYGSQWGSSSCYVIYMYLAHVPCCFNDKLYRRPWSNACSRPLDCLKVL